MIYLQGVSTLVRASAASAASAVERISVSRSRPGSDDKFALVGVLHGEVARMGSEGLLRCGEKKALVLAPLLPLRRDGKKTSICKRL